MAQTSGRMPTFLVNLQRLDSVVAIAGVLSRLSVRLERRVDRWFDEALHVSTCENSELADLTIDSANIEHGVEYRPTPYALVRRVLDRVPQSAKDFAFVDYGSGKGRVLFVAAEFPLRKIVGVEFAKELHDDAVRNHGTYRNSRQKCFDIQCVHADATQFQIPDEACILFFYAPFRPPVMRKVIETIAASYRKQPRKIRVIYANPFYKELFEECDFLRPVTEPKSWFGKLLPDRLSVAVYESP